MGKPQELQEQKSAVQAVYVHTIPLLNFRIRSTSSELKHQNTTSCQQLKNQPTQNNF